MKNMTLKQLNKELENKGIVFEAGPCDEYETCCYLEGMYEWGFHTVTYCAVIDPIMTFYDWKYQSICDIDLDAYTNHRVMHGVLSAETKHLFTTGVDKFCYDLRHGAPVHIEDVVAIYVDCLGNLNPAAADRRIYVLNNGCILYKEDCQALKSIKAETMDQLKKEGNYHAIESDCYQSNVNILNNMIVLEQFCMPRVMVDGE